MASSSFSLPDDILIDVFSRLPPDSIYRLRCLSKVWLSNLSSPNFITRWFQICEKSPTLILYYTIIDYGDAENPLKFRNAYPESHSQLMSRNEHLFSFKFLMNQKPFRRSRLYLLGSSNGLVLCCSYGSDDKRRYHVCNPLTKTWVTLPSPPRSEVRRADASGIVCEYSSSFACCYKVVRIPGFHQPSKKFNVDIFSSDSGVWESNEVSCDEKVSWVWNKYDKVVILNGVLYWIEWFDRMVVYNPNQENRSDGHRCSLIDLPDVEFGCSRSSRCIVESEARVCYAQIERKERKATVSVWVLDEVNCWQVLHKEISIEDILAEVRSPPNNAAEKVQVLGFSPVDHNVVFLGCKYWVWGFNTQTGILEELCLDNRPVRGADDVILPFVLKPMPTVLPPPSWIDT